MSEEILGLLRCVCNTVAQWLRGAADGVDAHAAGQGDNDAQRDGVCHVDGDEHEAAHDLADAGAGAAGEF